MLFFYRKSTALECDRLVFGFQHFVNCASVDIKLLDVPVSDFRRPSFVICKMGLMHLAYKIIM